METDLATIEQISKDLKNKKKRKELFDLIKAKEVKKSV